MKRVLCFIVTLSVALSALPARGLRAIETEDVEISEDRRESVSTYTTENDIQISVVVEDSKDSDYYRYGVNIVNLSDGDFRFDESSVSISQGNFEKGRWRELKFTNPSDFYHEKETELKVESVLTALAFGAAIIDAFTPPVLGHRYRHYAPPLIPPVPHGSGAVFLGLGIAGVFEQVEDQDNLDYLKDNLLFSTVVAAGDEYSGFIYVPKGSGPDYKMEIDLGYELAEFYFSKFNRRSDSRSEKRKSSVRNEVKTSKTVTERNAETKKTEKNSNLEINVVSTSNDKLGFVFSYGLPFEGVSGFGGYAIYTEPGAGFYFGFDGYGDTGSKSIGELSGSRSVDLNKGNGRYSYTLEDVHDSTRDYGCISLGSTFAIFPELALMLGFGLDFSETYYYGDIYEKRSGESSSVYYKSGWVKDSLPSFSFSPQIGINFVAGPVDLAVLYSYRFGANEDPYRLNIMAGFAF